MKIVLQLLLGVIGAPCAVAAAIGLRLLAFQLLQRNSDDPSDFFIAIVLPVSAVCGIFYGVFRGGRLHAWLCPDEKDAPFRFRVRDLLVLTTLLAAALGIFMLLR